MGMLMLTCPTTARKFATGIEMDESTFDALPDIDSSLQCPHCGDKHTWRPSDAWLENVPAA
jgi:hypothetical protein